MSILAIGSANLDMVMKVDRLPARGETVTGGVLSQAFGGKGANQAVAAARAGGSVVYVGCVGKDDAGERMARHFADEGLDIRHLHKVSGEATGTALIVVDQLGNNMIAVAPGANYSIEPEQVHQYEPLMRDADMLLLQCELRMDTLEAILRQAFACNCPVMLNLAPAKSVDLALLGQLDWLIVNETEAEFLSGLEIVDLGSASDALKLLDKRVNGGVVLTLGERGSLLRWADQTRLIPTFEVEAVDSTAAGDVYCGALAVGLVEGMDVERAVRFASAAAALSVTKLGAQPSAPHRRAIDQLLATDR